MDYKQMLIDEIGGEVPKGKGCIIFDLACLFPYKNQDILTFDFQLGEQKLEPYKHNHRYPNHRYVTISKKIGRKVSKLGYLEYVNLNEEQIMVLVIKVGIKDKVLKLCFPVKVMLTEDKPVCNLTLRYRFDKSEFVFMSYYEIRDGGWRSTMWTNNAEDDSEECIVMNNPVIDKDRYVAIYNEILTPHPQSINHLLL